MADDYGLRFKVEPEIDKSALENLTVSLKRAADAGLKTDKITKDMQKMLELEARAKEIRQEIERYSANKNAEAKKIVRALQKDLDATIREGKAAGGDLGKTKREEAIAKTGNKIADIALKVGDKLIDITKESWAEMQNIISYGRLSNQHTRDLAFGYGFTGSQAYGYDKAMSAMGFSSMEDLMYANDWERSRFQELMSKYAEKYTQLYDSGFYQKQIEYQIEMNEMKQDLQLELVEFFVANKDEIKTVMTVIVKTGEFLIQALGWIVSNFPTGDKAFGWSMAAKSDSISNSVYAPRNVKVENTLNISGDTSKQTRDAYTFIMEQISSATKVLEQ